MTANPEIEIDRLTAEVATYRHAFETTAADRDRWAAHAKELQARLDATAMEAAAASEIAGQQPASSAQDANQTTAVAGASKLTPPPAVPEELLALRPMIGDGPLLGEIAAIIEHPDFKALEAACEPWPPLSTIAYGERAMLIWIIKAVRASNALEIGTYYAGTSMLLAAAMQSQDHGHVYTIDPYGEKRAPAVLAQWPAELRNRVTFTAKYASLYLMMINVIPTMDLIFVDGSHDYPNVLHDLSGSLLNLRPGGYMVIDNLEQPEVLTATRDFLRLEPGVDSAAVNYDTYQRYSVFDVRKDEPATMAFAVLRKPTTLTVGRRPVGYHVFELERLKFNEMKIRIDPTSSAGTLKVKYWLRALSNSAFETEDPSEEFKVEISGDKDTYELPLSISLTSRCISGFRRMGEIQLYFVGASHGVTLKNMRVFLDGREMMPGRNKDAIADPD
jgi:predicted O-methyltransferase YrrM